MTGNNKIALISFSRNSLNIRQLSSCLKKEGFETACIYFVGSTTDKEVQLLNETIKKEGIGLVGISLVTDDYVKAVKITLSLKANCQVPVVWGGAHVNVMPEESLNFADAICLGEGESAIVDFSKAYFEKGEFDYIIKNWWYSVNGQIIKNEIRDLIEDLDQLPLPDFNVEDHILIQNDTLQKGVYDLPDGEYCIMSSRGCPYSCCYCYNNYRRKQFTGKGRYLRLRSLENVMEELEQAKRVYKNMNKVSFYDDSFLTRSIEDFRKFEHLYTEKINLPFFALIEPMAFNYDRVKILKNSGLVKLQIGIQTGSERVNKTIYKRDISNDKVIEMAHALKKLDLEILYDVIFNNPYETQDDMKETIAFLLQLPRPFRLQGYNLIFYPGTEITANALADGYIQKNQQESVATIESENDSPIASTAKVSKVSDRFYSIHYDTKSKEYYNTIIFLLATNRVPRFLIEFFALSPNGFIRKNLLFLLTRGYKSLAFLKRKVVGII